MSSIACSRCAKRGYRCAVAGVVLVIAGICGAGILYLAEQGGVSGLQLLARSLACAVVVGSGVWFVARSDKHFTGVCRCPEEERQLSNLQDRIAGSELR